MNCSSLPRKQIEKTITKSAKKIIAESSISPSRSGGKKLEHLVKRFSDQPFSSLETAIQLGEELGQKLLRSLKQSVNKTSIGVPSIKLFIAIKIQG